MVDYTVEWVRGTNGKSGYYERVPKRRRPLRVVELPAGFVRGPRGHQTVYVKPDHRERVSLQDFHQPAR